MENSQDKIKGLSLFSNVGIGEYYLKDTGVEICVANELKPKRARFYKEIYPNTDMICGDLEHWEINGEIEKKYREHGCDFIMASPPCDSFSAAGKRDMKDPRGYLFLMVLNLVLWLSPTNIIIENVPGFFTQGVYLGDRTISCKDYVTEELELLGYAVNSAVLDAADYGTPQHRKRAIMLASKIRKWEFPKPDDKQITVREAIGDLPSLESGETSDIPNHNANVMNPRHIEWARHTPSGGHSCDNPVHFPKKEDGTRIKSFRTAYSRIPWDKPAPTITECNGSFSSQNNGHPGRLLSDGSYSDARVLTIAELLRMTGLPDDYPIPTWASDTLIRNVIGECFAPKLVQRLISTMPRAE